jgi:hypothetical protein
MPEHTLDSILDLLNLHRQRATYGAVARIVNRPPTFLMSGRTRDQRHSWVVNHRTGMPTGYEPEQIHPQLQETSEVIQTGDELSKWLSAVSGDEADSEQAEAPASTVTAAV